MLITFAPDSTNSPLKYVNSCIRAPHFPCCNSNQYDCIIAQLLINFHTLHCESFLFSYEKNRPFPITISYGQSGFSYKELYRTHNAHDIT